MLHINMYINMAINMYKNVYKFGKSIRISYSNMFSIHVFAFVFEFMILESICIRIRIHCEVFTPCLIVIRPKYKRRHLHSYDIFIQTTRLDRMELIPLKRPLNV